MIRRVALPSLSKTHKPSKLDFHLHVPENKKRPPNVLLALRRALIATAACFMAGADFICGGQFRDYSAPIPQLSFYQIN
jgi:hypothetical protein